jgi:hypothetical protein
MSSKEGRGGLARFGIGRGGSDAENKSGDEGTSESKTATATADKRAKAQAEIVTAPAVQDGEGSASAESVTGSSAAPSKTAPSKTAPSKAAPAKAAAGAPVTASANGSGSTKTGTTAAVVDAPEKPVRKIPLAPSRASARAEKAEPNASDAPIPRSRLGRTKGSDAIRAPRVRRARLKIANIDPWSVMKVSFLFSVALGVILLVAVALLWLLLDFMGFFSTVASTVDDISGEEGSAGFDVVAFFSLPRVLGMATIVALVDIVMITALTTLCAYLYNISTDLVGGVEVTLAEEE